MTYLPALCWLLLLLWCVAFSAVCAVIYRRSRELNRSLRELRDTLTGLHETVTAPSADTREQPAPAKRLSPVVNL